MARFLVALFAATVIAVQAGQLGHAAPSTAEVFWRAVLPGSPLPDAILRLLRLLRPADTNSFVSKAEVEVPFNYQDYKRPSDDDYREDSSKRSTAAAATRAGDTPFNYAYGGSDKRPGAAAGAAREFDYDDYSSAEKRRGATVGDSPFQYSYKAPSKSHAEERRGAVVGEPPFLYAYKAPSKSHAEERRGAVVGEPPFLYAYKAPSKSHAGERRGAVVGEPPFLYAYKAPSKSHVGERRGAVVGEPPFLYAYKAPSTSEAGERRGAVVGEPPFLYAYKAPRTSQAGGERRGATAGDSPFQYSYKAPSKSHAVSGASGAVSRPAATTTVFFHEEAVHVGERLPFHFPPATTSALGFMPRRVADSIPFTTPALPGVLAMLGVAPGSAMAASMEATLRTCESPTISGESKFCATSLEALVERAMAVLGTRDVRALTSTLPRAGAPLQAYTVRAVRPVEGGPSFVACHDEAYPYTVYRCHTTGPARAYMVEMEGARGGGAVTVATVCHTDTSLWNPEHVSFRLLGTKPGGAPVCHLMPYGHIIWAKNVKRSPA